MGASGDKYHNQSYLRRRTDIILSHFNKSLGIDDFMNRVEIALFSYGFTGENTIGGSLRPHGIQGTRPVAPDPRLPARFRLPAAMSNLCRDEITYPLKDKIDAVFGWSFNTMGIAGVLTCGLSGMRAGLSHSPISRADEGNNQKVRSTKPMHASAEQPGGGVYPSSSSSCDGGGGHRSASRRYSVGCLAPARHSGLRSTVLGLQTANAGALRVLLLPAHCHRLQGQHRCHRAARTARGLVRLRCPRQGSSAVL